jgi:hypothetical protein
MPALALEVATYEAQLPLLLKEAAEGYVLIKGEHVEGVYADRGEALTRGYILYPDEDFLVRKVQANQPVREYPLPLSAG